MISQGFHRGFTAAEKTELWDRWQRGESLKAIGRAFSKPSSSIYFQLAPHGGIRPAARRRSRLALTLSEREEISRGLNGTSCGTFVCPLVAVGRRANHRDCEGLSRISPTESGARRMVFHTELFRS